MWRFKHFMPKEQTGLDGRTIDIGNIKVHVRNVIAEGGFSCVYLARDVVHTSKQYALKHIMCNDEESLDLVKKEVSVMKSLKGHPNVVTLHAQAIFDMGRTKEALLVMEFCEKSLVSVLENRGTAYFEEKQILSIFRDICNAVFAMHCQSPPIAHRDLKAENVLLGPDGSWKLCDFGSTSTNHKRFDRPEEMGVEEDNIRKHTTPAYRAPEMWDLFRREIISEKVDIWALGCLLYRICYLKSAFDGESKLQILNGNYRIAELPKYSSSITDLIRDMLQGSPDDRPDITQVWFRVNEQLPPELQKQLPDSPALDIPDEDNSDTVVDTVFSGNPGPPKKAPMPRRTPPAPPSSAEQVRNVSPQQAPQSQGTSKAAGGGAPLGIFWSTQHAKESHVSEEKGPIFDEPNIESTSKHNHRVGNNSPPKGHRNTQAVRAQIKRSTRENSPRRSDDKPTKDIEISFFPEEKQNCDSEKIKMSKTENVSTFQNEAFNNFVADFDCSKLNPAKSNNNNNKFGSKKEEPEVEVERLKEQLKQANLEKAEITSKYDKLSAICRSQRQEIQELKNALTEKSSSADKDGLKIQDSPGSWHSNTPQREKSERWEAQQGMSANSSIATSPESKPWLAFPDEPKSHHLSKNNQSKSVRTTERQKNKQSVVSSANDTWGFDQDSFVANPTSSQISRTTSTQGNYSQRFSEPKKIEQKQVSQPAGWAGF